MIIFGHFSRFLASFKISFSSLNHPTYIPVSDRRKETDYITACRLMNVSAVWLEFTDRRWIISWRYGGVDIADTWSWRDNYRRAIIGVWFRDNGPTVIFRQDQVSAALLPYILIIIYLQSVNSNHTDTYLSRHAVRWSIIRYFWPATLVLRPFKTS